VQHVERRSSGFTVSKQVARPDHPGCLRATPKIAKRTQAPATAGNAAAANSRENAGGGIPNVRIAQVALARAAGALKETPMAKLEKLLQSLAATVPASQIRLDQQWQTAARRWASRARAWPPASPLLEPPCRPVLARTSFDIAFQLRHDRQSGFALQATLFSAAYAQRCRHSNSATHRLRLTVDTTGIAPLSQPLAAATP
jgi:hypothetical protein